MSVCYLDVHDEITDAVARLRAASDGRVIVVLPPGSRIGTSRINFRLLLREAESRGIALDLVSGEPEVRALAVSAGLRAYTTVAAAELVDQPVADAVPGRGGGTMSPPSPSPSPSPAAQTSQPVAQVPDPPRGAAPSDPPTAAHAAPEMATGIRRPPVAQGARSVPPPNDPHWKRSETGTFAVTPRAANAGQGAQGVGDAWIGNAGADRGARGQWRRRARIRRALGWTIRLAILLILVGGVAYGAYVYLPTATINLTPGTQPFGPTTFAITADPTVSVADSATGKVPAEHVGIPLTETATFDATGRAVNLSKAQGTVTFTSTNTFIEVPIPAGTVVGTAGGTEFQTVDFASLSKAVNVPPGASVDVTVRASAPGPNGNVNAGTIKVLRDSLKSLLVTVTNKDATSGGRKTEITTVTRDDYDSAIALLTQKLNDDLETALTDPNTSPRGLTVYPETAKLGRLTASAAAGDVVGTKVDTFDLSVDAQANVLAVDEALVASVASDQLVATAPAGVRVFTETVTTDLSPGVVSGNTIVYQVSAEARQYRPVDPAQLQEQVRGKTLSEAQSILQAYGTVVVSIWPDFVPTIPTDVRRINLTIETPDIPK